MKEYDLGQFPPCCFLMEVTGETGVNGPIMVGDVLVLNLSQDGQPYRPGSG
uniref:hypothetical protein n=1 Tax=Vreelandella venusta TaxID=44935 RepID=UPI001557B22E|nr:hypothetical protein [Halomonas hydrothermalis]